MTCFVDIDQTISYGHVGRDLAASVQYYRDRGVVVPDGITRWPDLFQLPDVLRQHEVLPGALAGVRFLEQSDDVWYATVRAPDVAQITRVWLAEQGFPSPDQVVICQSVGEKLLALAQYPGRLVLIDDRWRKALDLWSLIVQHDPDAAASLRERLTLVAFGVTQSDLPESSVVPVVPLPDWSCISNVLTSIREVPPLRSGSENAIKRLLDRNKSIVKKG